MTTSSPMSLLDFIIRRVGVGELVRRRVDWLPKKNCVSLPWKGCCATISTRVEPLSGSAGTFEAFMGHNSSNLESFSISPTKAACFFLSGSRLFQNSSYCSFFRFCHNFLSFSTWVCKWWRQALHLFWGVLDDWLLLV